VSEAFASVYVLSDVAGPENCMNALPVPPFLPVSGEVPGLTWASAGVSGERQRQHKHAAKLHVKRPLEGDFQ
jgi:hypothetical protein